jgi:hypothetical protein
LEQLAPFGLAWKAIESHALLKLVLDGIIIEIIMISAAMLFKFTALDNIQRASVHPAKKIAWHAIHLINLAAMILLWILLVVALLEFGKTLLSVVTCLC